MNNFNFIILLFYYRQKHQRLLTFLPANISFSDSSSEDALAGAACCTMGQQVAESIHAAVNAITRAYTSISDKLSQVQCILQEHHGQVCPILVHQMPQAKKKRKTI